MTHTYTVGMLGCALSHLTLWERAIASEEVLTVCEDDAVFNHGFEQQAPAILASLPADWDFVLWGWNLDLVMVLDMGIGPCLTLGDYENLPRFIAGFQTTRTASIPIRLRSAIGTPAYSISPKGARALRDFCLPIRPMMLSVLLPRPGEYTLKPTPYGENRGIDMMMSNAYPNIRAFVSFPPLVVSLNERGTSTTQGSPLLRDLL